MNKIAPARLSLEDFICEMSQIPSRELRLPALKDLFGRLDLKDELVTGNIHFAAQAYARNLVCRTPRFDMLVLCWRPGNVTTIHDHAGSLNVTRVVSGGLTSRTFARGERPAPGKCLVRLEREEKLASGAVSCVDHGEVHQLANTTDADLVTVHVYARPLKDITVYCPETGNVDRVTLRYTLEDEFA
jgi:predicted metal-dependent enzyme (double-stranded beta helix superfamily)